MYTGAPSGLEESQTSRSQVLPVWIGAMSEKRSSCDNGQIYSTPPPSSPPPQKTALAVQTHTHNIRNNTYEAAPGQTEAWKLAETVRNHNHGANMQY